MALSWNEIKNRALNFSKEWENESRERAEKDTFWNDFFNIFGISRRRVATFEEPVKKLNNKQGFIDLFWKGTLLVEHKSKGKNLDAAFEQATDYFFGIKEHELPKYVLVSDFERFRLYNLDDKTVDEFHLNELHENIKLFGFVAGYQKRTFADEDPVNIKAAELMGNLHDQLKESGYEGHPLEVFLVRLLFCLFADDTGIFEKDTFKESIELKTHEDGSDLGAWLAQFFQVLNTPPNKRLKNLDEQLNSFPYVNGKLFEEPLPISAFNSKMREIILECSSLNWGEISPAIFGSMFQSVMNPKDRRNLGAHYTSEKNILKLIKPLFLDELHKEFEKVKSSKNKLREFHKKLGSLKFLDPACGCGNFLIITYRELRQLELEVLKILYGTQQVIAIDQIMNVDVDQFYGIEYDEFPARVAEVALWLMDHQMNLLVSEAFGLYYARLPLKKSAKIIHGNALRIDWDTLVEGENLDVTANRTNIVQLNEPIPHYETINVYTKTVNFTTGQLPAKDSKWENISNGKVDYVFGNPPFVGTAYQSKKQKDEIKNLYFNVKSAGMLDYVTGWYLKAAKYIHNTNIKAAFVSTNTITQGEQVGILWKELFEHYNIKIHFAHRTFKWFNEAKGKAAVHVVIIGFGSFNIPGKKIYHYEKVSGEPLEMRVKNINPYLVDGADYYVTKRMTPICDVPKSQSGSAARDGGNLILSDEEKIDILNNEPEIAKVFRRFISGNDFINNIVRWCIWLKDIPPQEFRMSTEIHRRISEVKKFREQSTRQGTKKMAAFPTLFAEERQPNTDFLIIPKVSSENRIYIPIAYLTKENIVSDKTFIVPNATLYHFGILTSMMHMSWMRQTCMRLGGSYSYSNSIVYNNFPWPKNPNKKQLNSVETKAQKILDIRAEFPESSLADLYDPLTMPPKLVKAHHELDKAVDLCYRSQPFANETGRIEFLFDLYNEYISQISENNIKEYLTEMTMSTKIKQQILNKIIEIIDKQIESTKLAIASAKESRDNETKCSSGDKYETGRTMMNFELEKTRVLLNKTLSTKNDLLQINLHKKHNKVTFGSLVFTTNGNYFICIALGKTEVANETFYSISLASPIGKLLNGKKEKAKFTFQGKDVIIMKIL
ncbi:MAG: hypothetical protein L3J54_00140 [Draconibacterium sp.]|nr:hypothetical protein [Draconibacterium sp.]